MPYLYFLDFLNETLTSQSDLLKEMDLTTEIRSRKALLASAGSEFDFNLTISAAERLRINRINVKETLGLDDLAEFEDLEKELVKDEDIQAGFEKVKAKVVVEPPIIDLEKLSARERIAMKRKARLNSQASAKHAKKSDDNLSTVTSTASSTSTTTTSMTNNSSEINLNTDAFESIESDALWFCERMKEKLLKYAKFLICFILNILYF